MIKLTGLWAGKTKDDRTYFSGSLGGVKFFVFENKNKKSENSPDYELCLADNRSRERYSEETAAVETRADEDDIPF